MLQLFIADTDSHLSLAYADGGIRAGFPSPAQDYISETIDLNRVLVRKASERDILCPCDRRLDGRGGYRRR